MAYGLIDRKNHKFYTYLSKVFEAIENKQKDYNWLISDCECYPRNKELETLFDQEYCWISGEELTAIIEEEDFQWIWAVLCGFEKDVPLSEILKHPLPNAQDYDGYYYNPVALQHPLSTLEIVPCDSSWTLLISEKKELIDHYIRTYPEAQNLAEFNKR